MKVRLIVHRADHSICYGKDKEFKVEIDPFQEPDVSGPIGPMECQHGKPAVILTCELQVPRKEA